MFDYFWSDPHFGHKNIIHHCDRPFQDVKHMTESLIENYNSVVEKDDFVLWVGDCFFCGTQEAKRIMDALNGKKALVLGNHDRSSGKMVSLGFEFVTKELMLRVADTSVRVSHYPYYGDSREGGDRYEERRPTVNEQEVLIHGHVHSTEVLKDRMIHVGVDAWDYTPAHYTAVYSLVCKARMSKHGGSNGKDRVETA